MWVLLRPPRFGGAKHAINHDDRSRHRKVSSRRASHFPPLCRPWFPLRCFVAIPLTTDREVRSLKGKQRKWPTLPALTIPPMKLIRENSSAEQGNWTAPTGVNRELARDEQRMASCNRRPKGAPAIDALTSARIGGVDLVRCMRASPLFATSRYSIASSNFRFRSSIRTAP